MSNLIEIEQIRSVIGNQQWMRVIVRTLGLRHIRHKRILTDSPSIRGMVNKVPHLVTLRKAPEGSSQTQAKRKSTKAKKENAGG